VCIGTLEWVTQRQFNVLSVVLKVSHAPQNQFYLKAKIENSQRVRYDLPYPLAVGIC